MTVKSDDPSASSVMACATSASSSPTSTTARSTPIPTSWPHFWDVRRRAKVHTSTFRCWKRSPNGWSFRCTTHSKAPRRRRARVLGARDRWRVIGSPSGKIPALLPPSRSDRWESRMDAAPSIGEPTQAILREFDLADAAVACSDDRLSRGSRKGASMRRDDTSEAARCVAAHRQRRRVYPPRPPRTTLGTPPW